MREDLNALFHEVAEQAMERRRQFDDLMPFGMTLRPDGGKVMMVAEGEDTLAMIARLRAGLGNTLRDGSARAAIIAYEAKVEGVGGRKVDALLFDLEHQGGETVRMFIEIRKRIFGGIKYGESGRIEAEPALFTGAAGGDDVAYENMADLERLLTPFIEANVTPFLDEHPDQYWDEAGADAFCVYNARAIVENIYADEPDTTPFALDNLAIIGERLMKALLVERGRIRP